ncbi:MAG: helix-turn-helix transcriptional regulator [Ruminococcaceae bacterium]|nr:helix-turn-helix transcriptional regulator [Oscillospiraceae bacterium]
MLNLDMLQSESVRIDKIAINHGKVKPSDELVCREGSRLFDRFFYISKGTIYFDLPSGESFSASTGDIVYLPNNCVYSCRWDSEPVGEHFTIAFVLFNSKNELCSLGDKIEIAISDKHGKYLSYCINLCEAWFRGELGYMFKCYSLLWDFFHNLFIDLETKNLKHRHHGVYKALLYLKNNYTTDVSPEYLANLCNMSMTAFRRQFAEVTGTSPVKYKNRLRMEKAEMLLKTGEYNVTEVSNYVGCPDIYYFNKLFNRYIGTNPSDLIP